MKLSEVLKGLEDNTLVKIDSQEIEEKLDDQALIDIGEHLQNNTSVTEINIGCELLTARGVAALCESLKYNETILTLSFSGMKSHSAWLDPLIVILKSNTHIETLKLNNNHLTDTVLEPLIKVIGRNNVKNLYLDDNLLTSISLQSIIAKYKIRHHMTLLSLKNNSLVDGDIQLIANYLEIKGQIPLQGEAYLTQLFLDKNKITDKGIEYLANAMDNNRFLTTLSVADNPYSEKSKIALAKISVILSSNQEFFKQYQAADQFLSLDQHFKKIAEKPGEGENPGGIYLNLKDDTKWLFKLNPGAKNLDERIGALQEFTAGNIMALLIPDYPQMRISLDGGSFKVGYSFIEDLTYDHSKINDHAFVKYIFASYLMCYLFADPDAPGNRWFYESIKDNSIYFYKGDLGMAFDFSSDHCVKSIDGDSISNESIANFFQLPVEFVNAHLTNEVKIATLKEFSEISEKQIRTACYFMSKLLGEYGENNVKKILQRADQVRAVTSTLIWKLQQQSIKTPPLPKIPPEPKVQSKLEEDNLEQKQSSGLYYRHTSF